MAVPQHEDKLVILDEIQRTPQLFRSLRGLIDAGRRRGRGKGRFLFLGSAYYQARQPNIDAFHIAFYNDRDYELLITGSLAEAPDYRDKYTNLRINVKAVDTGDGD